MPAGQVGLKCPHHFSPWLAAPKGIWGPIVERFGWQLFPLERRVLFEDRSGAKMSSEKALVCMTPDREKRTNGE
jgi:hypothetical protein